MNKHKLALTTLGVALITGTILYAHNTGAGTARTVCNSKDGKIVCTTGGGDSGSKGITTTCIKEDGKIKCKSVAR